MVNLKTEWTGGPKPTNGAYGLYPVESKNVLIDGCVAIGASDAGIYVGQSQQIIVRNSSAHYNVAGIEIENSYFADVYNNLASHNTGGILVFDLPDLPQQGGRHVRVYNNRAINNDTDNFAPEGNIVGEVPRGTGIIIQANSDVEIFDNDISGNGTVNLSIVTYANDTEDENYYPHPKSIQVHNNRFSNGGFDPDIGTGALAPILVDLSEGDIPDIFWDGILPISQMLFGQPEIEKLVIKDNGDATFLALNPLRFQFSIGSPISRDIEEYLIGVSMSTAIEEKNKEIGKKSQAVREKLISRTGKSGEMSNRAHPSLAQEVVQTVEMPHQIYIDSAEGPYLTDLDGNSYIDLTGGFGPNVLGNKAKVVENDLASQVK